MSIQWSKNVHFTLKQISFQIWVFGLWITARNQFWDVFRQKSHSRTIKEFQFAGIITALIMKKATGNTFPSPLWWLNNSGVILLHLWMNGRLFFCLNNPQEKQKWNTQPVHLCHGGSSSAKGHGSDVLYSLHTWWTKKYHNPSSWWQCSKRASSWTRELWLEEEEIAT